MTICPEPKEIEAERKDRLLFLVNRIGTPAMTPELFDELQRLLDIEREKLILAVESTGKQ